MKSTEWKVNQYDWVTIKGFIEVMKKYEPHFKEWNISLGDPINNSEDGSFNRLVYIDGKPVKVEKP
jgi:hypothetical protein